MLSRVDGTRVSKMRAALFFAISVILAAPPTFACSPALIPINAPKALCPAGGERWVPYGNACAGWGEPIYFTALDHIEGFAPTICPGNRFPIYRSFSDDEKARLSELVLTDAYQAINGRHSTYARASWIADALGEAMNPDLRFALQLGTSFARFVEERPSQEIDAFAKQMIDKLATGDFDETDPRRRNSALRLLAMTGRVEEARKFHEAKRPGWHGHRAFKLDSLGYDSLEICFDSPDKYRLSICHPKGMVGFAELVVSCLNPSNKLYCSTNLHGFTNDPTKLAEEVKALSASIPKFSELFTWGLRRIMPKGWSSVFDCIETQTDVANCSKPELAAYQVQRVARTAEFFSTELGNAAKQWKAESLYTSDGTCPLEKIYPRVDLNSDCTTTTIRNIAFSNGRCLSDAGLCKAGFPVDLTRLSTLDYDPSPYIAFEQTNLQEMLNRQITRLAFCRIRQTIEGDASYCPEDVPAAEGLLMGAVNNYQQRFSAAMSRELRLRIDRVALSRLSEKLYEHDNPASLLKLDNILAHYPEMNDYARQQFDRYRLRYE